MSYIQHCFIRFWEICSQTCIQNQNDISVNTVTMDRKVNQHICTRGLKYVITRTENKSLSFYEDTPVVHTSPKAVNIKIARWVWMNKLSSKVVCIGGQDRRRLNCTSLTFFYSNFSRRSWMITDLFVLLSSKWRPDCWESDGLLEASKSHLPVTLGCAMENLFWNARSCHMLGHLWTDPPNKKILRIHRGMGG